MSHEQLHLLLAPVPECLAATATSLGLGLGIMENRDVWRQTGKQLRVGAVDGRVQHEADKGLHDERMQKASLVVRVAVEVGIEVAGVGGDTNDAVDTVPASKLGAMQIVSCLAGSVLCKKDG
ncbi:hypothetical protein CMQ_5786 [Grosmannia clavigera kw1407]|uniref:Uncharacterized protein n=1 Tax=Grosmannia clavigera (strain kw1407 / UAMH 11150) TaxID=655863 RepID=F0XSI0_GROCL|nr:uncharacterized protein CMQ_5786 [Grosmannia clavigera kw1407]EFW99365.1 hypothetical protein CMQ_5786 [Grosmannia clavigera kw1407]